MSNILAIDPGNEFSAYVVMDAETCRPLEFGKVKNGELRRKIADGNVARRWDAVVIERIQSYGMAVGREVFETCEWVGRFTEDAVLTGDPVHYVYRIEEKRRICCDPRANDANIRRALIDRFAAHDFKNGKGTKAKPDFFHGFHADIWAAFAVGVTFLDRRNEAREEHREGKQ